MWTDELFDEIQKGDKVWYETAQGQVRSGKAVMIGPMGWVIDTGAGEPKVVNEGYIILATSLQRTDSRIILVIS